MQGEGSRHLPHFRAFCSPATTTGECGVQVWLSHKLARLVTTVQALSPRLIRVSLQVGGIILHFISGHAPIEDASTASKADFGDALERELSDCSATGALFVLCIDANARLGSFGSPVIGSYDIDNENSNGAILRAAAEARNAPLVNTWWPAGYTWRAANGAGTARLDYLMVSSTRAAAVSSCSVVESIDLAKKNQGRSSGNLVHL